MLPLKESHQLYHSIPKKEKARFLRYLDMEGGKSTEVLKNLSELLEKYDSENDLIESGEITQITPTPQVYRRVNELKLHLENFISLFIADQEIYTELNRRSVFMRYLRKNNLFAQFKVVQQEVEKEIEESHLNDSFRSLFINYLNEIRINFFRKYYEDRNYKFNSMASNYSELEKVKGWIQNSHLLNKIFFDFSLRAAHKIEIETLQKQSILEFKPQFFSFQEYLDHLDNPEVPLMYKTLILDILEAAEDSEIKPEKYLKAAERIFYGNYEGESESVKNNLLVCLVTSGKIPSAKKLSYFEELVELKENLSAGVLFKYIVECLEDDTKKARKEFTRLKERAVEDPENDLFAIEGILLLRESQYEPAIEKLNQVTIYQQDNMYFDVNLSLLEAYLELGDLEVADSKLNNLKVYYHKYKEHLPREKESQYKNEISRYKKLLDSKSNMNL
jgi:hypothetical protein